MKIAASTAGSAFRISNFFAKGVNLPHEPVRRVEDFAATLDRAPGTRAPRMNEAALNAVRPSGGLPTEAAGEVR